MSPKELLKLAWLPALIASLCCVAPVVVVLFGLGSVAFAAALSDILYGTYDFIFLLAGLGMLMVSLTLYFARQKNICTVSEAKKRRHEIINTSLTLVAFAALLYVVWNFIIVELVGIALGIWSF